MKIITHYMVIKEEGVNAIEDKIKQLLNDSDGKWQPYGELKCIYDHSVEKIIYIQAMIGGK